MITQRTMQRTACKYESFDPEGRCIAFLFKKRAAFDGLVIEQMSCIV